MRFSLNLSLVDRNRNVLPDNYQYELSSWIYKVINHSDPAFAEWLHNRGFSNVGFRINCHDFLFYYLIASSGVF